MSGFTTNVLRPPFLCKFSETFPRCEAASKSLQQLLEVVGGEASNNLDGPIGWKLGSMEKCLMFSSPVTLVKRNENSHGIGWICNIYTSWEKSNFSYKNGIDNRELGQPGWQRLRLRVPPPKLSQFETGLLSKVPGGDKSLKTQRWSKNRSLIQTIQRCTPSEPQKSISHEWKRQRIFPTEYGLFSTGWISILGMTRGYIGKGNWIQISQLPWMEGYTSWWSWSHLHPGWEELASQGIY